MSNSAYGQGCLSKGGYVGGQPASCVPGISVFVAVFPASQRPARRVVAAVAASRRGPGGPTRERPGEHCQWGPWERELPTRDPRSCKAIQRVEWIDYRPPCPNCVAPVDREECLFRSPVNALNHTHADRHSAAFGHSAPSDRNSAPSLARRTRSASDCRLRGSFVSAVNSHAIAWINARSRGGKNGLAPASSLVFDGEITSSPAASPALHLASGQPYLLGRLVVFHVRLLVKQQCQAKSLHDLDRHSSAADCLQRHLHEIVGKSTRKWAWSWHGGVLYVPGFFWGVHLLLQKVRGNHDVICETEHQDDRHKRAKQPRVKFRESPRCPSRWWSWFAVR